MPNAVQLSLLLSGLLVCCLVCSAFARESCTSCGKECEPACGSRRYRTCCFNYLRKRSSPGPPPEHAEHAEQHPVQLELLLMPRDQELVPLGRRTHSLLHRLLDAPAQPALPALPAQPAQPARVDSAGLADTAPPLAALAALASEERPQLRERDWLDELGRTGARAGAAAAYNE